MASDYDGLGFAVGSVHGVRAYDVDKLGRLHGLYQGMVWKPGENVAECYRDHKTRKWSMTDCSCGFYAFNNGENQYKSPSRLTAVIEGYGETVIGSRGFRCTKARIVALHIPGGIRMDRQWPLLNWVRQKGIGGAIGPAAMAIGLFGLIFGGIMLASGILWGALLVLLGLVCGYLFTIAIKADFGSKKSVGGLSRETLDRVVRNYPDAEIFSSYKAMLEKYPVTSYQEEILEVTPETREDFWELEVDMA